jgi:flagellar motor switch protein FliN/FliY
MGSASTALSTIISQQVNITTPVVTKTTLRTLKKSFEVPNIALEVEYISGIFGENLLAMKITDAAIIANLMMGGDGSVATTELSEIEISAVSEAMNQMIGSAATSMATMFAREVNISPPNSRIWNDSTSKLTDNIDEDENIVQVSFKLTIGSLVDSNIMQLLPIDTAKKIVAIMMGTENAEPIFTEPVKEAVKEKPAQTYYEEPKYVQRETYREAEVERPIFEPQVEVHKASFQPLKEASATSMPRNIDLILDVPLEISVVLGRTKKNIRDILNLGTGSLIELDKLAEEPVEILVNGKIVAYGEVMVVDENFGVRITSIVSSADRVKSLSK